MLRRKFLMAVAAAAVAGLLGPTSARAGFSLSAVVGTDSTFVTSNGSATINDNNSPANTSAGSAINVTDVDPGVGKIRTPAVNTDGTTDPSPFTVGGVQLGLTENSTSNSAQAILSTTSNIVLKNTTGDGLYIKLTINNDQLTQPGSVDSHYVLTNALTILDFFKSDGVTYSHGVGTGDSVSAVSSASPDFQATSAVGSDSAVFSNTSTADYHRTGTPFTLTQTFTIFLKAGDAVQFQGSANVVPTPAPATAILALAGAPIFGAFGWMRRRKAVVA